MSYSAEVVADSVGPHGVRITSIVATYPRFIHSEVMTHRVFSRNAASSRAIPPEINIERVRTNPFVPEVFRKRVKGMGQGDELDDQVVARREWVLASRRAASSAEKLAEMGISKAHVNRVLEPFLWMTTIITSTEWSNFFALRQPDNDDPVPQYDHDAQPEFQIVARMMRDAMRESDPDHLDYGDWHLPFVDVDERLSGTFDRATLREDWANVSAGRCFVVSYDKLATIMDEPASKSYERSVKGRGVGHWSPLEHPAICCQPNDVGIPQFNANLRGWCSLRKFYPGEDDAQKMFEGATT